MRHSLTDARLLHPAVIALAATAIALAMILAAVTLVRSTEWDGRMGNAPPSEDLALGPISSGGAIEQTFTSPDSYLGAITLPIRRLDESHQPAHLELRLTHGEFRGEIVRQAVLSLSPSQERRTLIWEFDPIQSSAGTTYTLTAAVPSHSPAKLSFPVSLLNSLSGRIRTNGIPTGPHIDLTLSLFTRARGMDIWRSLFLNSPIATAAYSLALLLSMPAYVVLFRHIARRAPKTPIAAHPFPNTAIYAGLLAIALALLSRAAAWDSQPHMSPPFWASIIALIPITMALKLVIDAGPRRAAAAIVAWHRAAIHASESGVESAWNMLHPHVPLSTRWPLPQALRAPIDGGAAIAHSSTQYFANIFLQARLGWPICLALVFATAVLSRSAPLLSYTYTPWQLLGSGDDSDQYLRMAGELTAAAPDGLAFFGTMADTAILVPFAAALMAVLGAAAGLVAFSWASAFLGSLACVVLSLATHAATGSRLAALVSGLLLAITPLAIEYSLLMMSDGLGLFILSLSLWLFVLLLKRYTIFRGLAFGLCVGALVTDRSTGWFAGAFAWTFLYALLSLRSHYREHQRITPSTLGRALTPILALFAVMIAVESIARFTGNPHYYATNRGMVFAYVFPSYGLSSLESNWPLLALEFLRNIHLIIARLTAMTLTQIPFAVWLIPATWIALAIGLLSSRPLGQAVTRLLGMIVMAVALSVAFSLVAPAAWATTDYPPQVPNFGRFLDQPALLGFSLALPIILAVISRPFRLSFIAILPYAAGITLAFDSITILQARHLLPLLIIFYIGFGVATAYATRLAFAVPNSLPETLPSIPHLAQVSVTTILIVSLFAASHNMLVNVNDIRTSLADRQQERMYLKWLGTSVPANTVVLTTGRVNPWEVTRLTGLPVMYNVRYIGAAFLTNQSSLVDISRNCKDLFLAGCPSLGSVVSSLGEGGADLAFYDPDAFPDIRAAFSPLSYLDLIPGLELRNTAVYPHDNERGAWVLNRAGQVPGAT